MDYLSFIDEIDKIWNEKDNSKIAAHYSLSRSTLPALINLHREWKVSFQALNEERDILELELNHYKSDKDLSSLVDCEKSKSSLLEKVSILEDELYKRDDEIDRLKEELYRLQNSSIFKKIVG